MKMILDGISEAFDLLMSGDSLVFDAAWRSIWVSSTAVILATVIGISLGTFLAQHPFLEEASLSPYFGEPWVYPRYSSA